MLVRASQGHPLYPVSGPALHLSGTWKSIKEGDWGVRDTRTAMAFLEKHHNFLPGIYSCAWLPVSHEWSAWTTNDTKPGAFLFFFDRSHRGLCAHIGSCE